MHQFDEHHPEFKGFSELFEREIAPTLRDRDADRVVALRKGRIGGAVAAATIAFGAAGFGWYIQDLEVASYGLAFAFGAYIGVMALMMSKVRKATKGTLVGALFNHIGWSFEPEVDSFDYKPWREALLLPKLVTKASFEDRISGQAHGALFNSVEAHLQRQGNKRMVTVFRGQLIWLTFPKPLGMGRTIVLRDKGLFNAKKKKDMKRVGLVDPVFEKIFEAYSTDQVGARVVLDPVFMQRMVDLESALDGKNIRYAFDDRTMLIAVETDNLYEAGDMRTELADPARAQRILDEVGAAFDIVDHLVARPRRMAEPGPRPRA